MTTFRIYFAEKNDMDFKTAHNKIENYSRKHELESRGKRKEYKECNEMGSRKIGIDFVHKYPKMKDKKYEDVDDEGNPIEVIYKEVVFDKTYVVIFEYHGMLVILIQISSGVSSAVVHNMLVDLLSSGDNKFVFLPSYIDDVDFKKLMEHQPETGNIELIVSEGDTDSISMKGKPIRQDIDGIIHKSGRYERDEDALMANAEFRTKDDKMGKITAERPVVVSFRTSNSIETERFILEELMGILHYSDPLPKGRKKSNNV